MASWDPVSTVSKTLTNPGGQLKYGLGEAQGVWNDITGKSGVDDAKRKAAEIQQKADAAYDESKGIIAGNAAQKGVLLSDLSKATGQYAKDQTALANTYGSQVTGLAGQSAADAKALAAKLGISEKTLQSLMAAQSKDLAQGGISLKDAGDPNSAYQQNVRKSYDEQAAGTQKQGLTDAGTLAALGAQAMAGQTYNQPLTGAQLQAMTGGAQARSQTAYAQAAQEANRLRNLGREQAWTQAGLQFDRTGQTQDRLSQNAKDYGSLSLLGADAQKGLREEQGNFYGQNFGAKAGASDKGYGAYGNMLSMKMDNENTNASNSLAALMAKLGIQTSGLSAEAQNLMASNAANKQLFGGLAQAGATAYAGSKKQP